MTVHLDQVLLVLVPPANVAINAGHRVPGSSRVVGAPGNAGLRGVSWKGQGGGRGDMIISIQDLTVTLWIGTAGSTGTGCFVASWLTPPPPPPMRSNKCIC